MIDPGDKEKGSLVVVGTGIQLINHMTHEARLAIRAADKVLHVVTDYPTERYISGLNPRSESLVHLYGQGKPRQETYGQMVDAIMAEVRTGHRVCAVFYGHPGVFVEPSHGAIKVARSEGYEARMLPGVSAEDCLFADLGIDPGESGCQSFEATDFLIYRRRFDPTSSLILWQIGVVGVTDTRVIDRPNRNVEVLAEVLKIAYGGEHEVVIYEASPFPFPMSSPSMRRTTIDRLGEEAISQMATLYVPPKPPSLDKEMLARLGMVPH